MTASRQLQYPAGGKDMVSLYRSTALLLSILALLLQITIAVETIYPVCEQSSTASISCCQLKNLTLASTQECPLAECPVGYFMPSYTPSSTLPSPSSSVTVSLNISTTPSDNMTATDDLDFLLTDNVTDSEPLNVTDDITTPSMVPDTTSSSGIDLHVSCNVTEYPEIYINDNYGPCSVINISGGQFVLTTPCRPCSENCLRCTGASDGVCTDCEAGYFFFSGKCLEQCPSDFEGRAGICVAKYTHVGGSEDEDGVNVGAVVGGVIGGVLVLVIIIAIIIYFCRRRGQSSSETLHRRQTLDEMAKQREGHELETKIQIGQTDDVGNTRDSRPYSPHPSRDPDYADDLEPYKNDDVNNYNHNSEFYEVNISDRPLTEELDPYMNTAQAEELYETNVSNVPLPQESGEPSEIYENPDNIRNRVVSVPIDNAPPLPPHLCASGYFENEEVVNQHTRDKHAPSFMTTNKLAASPPHAPDRQKKKHGTSPQNPSLLRTDVKNNRLLDTNKTLPRKVPDKSQTFHDAMNALNNAKKHRSGSVPSLTVTKWSVNNDMASSDSYSSSYEAMGSKNKAAIMKARKGSLTPAVNRESYDGMDVYELPHEGDQHMDSHGGMASVLAELRQGGRRSAPVSEVRDFDPQDDYENFGNLQQNLHDMDSNGLVEDDTVYGNIPNAVKLPVPDYSQDENSDYECPPSQQDKRHSGNKTNDQVDSLDDLDDYENWQTIQKVMSK